ncbi:S8 family serine peptidase [Micromonospora sp. NPDC047740]|uniref:S8 family peptidase n=1 Tax=Micromonospora sp. NPDC047740 TaxID=3364254 RepID=UPI003719C634
MSVWKKRVTVAACAATAAVLLQAGLATANPYPIGSAVLATTATSDPFDVVYSVEYEDGKIYKAGQERLGDDAYGKVIPEQKELSEAEPKDPEKIQPALEELLASGDLTKHAEVVVTYREWLDIPAFPMPEFSEGRASERNKELLDEAQRLIEELRSQRAARYLKQTAVLEQFGGKTLDTYWLIQGVRAVLPLGAVRELVVSDDVQYIELADGVAEPPADANPDNDTIDARAQIASDPYFNLGQTAGWIGLLDTGVRESHTVFNGPDHLAIVDDISGDGDPSDQCNHGTASAALITGNGNLGANWRGVSAISLDSWDVYGNDCLVGGAATVDGFEEAVRWLDKVIVAEIQLNASETSASSTAADNAYASGSVVVAANGNFGSGAGTVRSPGNAHKALGIGAADLVSDALMGYSGRGPTADGRYKPDLVFPTNVETARSGSDTAMGSFGGTSCATPIAGGAVGLLRNWMRGGVGSIDAGHVYSHAILGGQTTWPFDNNTGAGPFRLGTGGHAWWGKVNIAQGTQVDIPITVAAGKTLLEGALWWPESVSRHNDVDLRLVAPDGTVRDLSISGVSVFERAGVSDVRAGGWKLRITGFSVTGTQTVYWSARTR